MDQLLVRAYPEKIAIFRCQLIAIMPRKSAAPKFESVEAFLAYLPDEDRQIVDELRAFILDFMPDCQEKLAYNVPYYYRRSRVCFIWPASVPWGNVPQFGVQLGFCKGSLITDPWDYLEKGKRKQVFVKTFAQVEEIDFEKLRYFMQEALEVDEMQGSRH